MKKLIAVVLVLMMSLTFLTSALAVEGQYANTRDFLKALDELDINYTVGGVDSDDDEKVDVGNKGDNVTYTIHYYFSKDNERVAIRIWNLIDFKEADFTKVLRAVNTINSSYKFVTYSVDETDNSISVSMDLIVREGNSVGDIVLEATLRLVNIIDDSFDGIGVYAK